MIGRCRWTVGPTGWERWSSSIPEQEFVDLQINRHNFRTSDARDREVLDAEPDAGREPGSEPETESRPDLHEAG
jgi:hypothetical protein